MMKRLTILALLLAATTSVPANDTIQINSFRYAGPFEVTVPHLVDSLNIDGKKFQMKSFLDVPLSLDAVNDACVVSTVPECDKDALHLLGFNIENRIYAKASIKVDGLKEYHLYVDGKKQNGGELSLEPATHDIVIKYLTSADSKDSLKVSIIDTKGRLSVRQDGKSIFSLDANTQGAGCDGVRVSASGKYISVSHSLINAEGKSSAYTEIIEASSGKVIRRSNEGIRWMPATDSYYYTRPDVNGRKLICADVATSAETVLAENLPDGRFVIPASGDYLYFTLEQEGPKEGDVHQILEPDDRQPGWRDRSYIARYDLRTGLMQPLTYGWHQTYLEDISDDGKTMLFMTSRSRLTERPTTLFSLYTMDLSTLQVECILQDDGFITGAELSPDGKQVLITGSPECLSGIGMDVPEGRTPNMYDYQLYLMNLSDKSVKPLTKDFAPSVQSLVWSRYDGKIYFYAEDKDCLNLFRLNPDNCKTERLPNKEEYLSGIDMARTAPTLVYYGQSLCNGYRAYSMDTKSLRQKELYDFSAERLDGIQIGEGNAYEFTSSKGDLINGFYVLPPDFDPDKKYPLIVHYYGGCSPSTRYCIGSYSPQVYAAQGYVFYVVNPSGASGFGQEFASRHVNTAGDGVAEDIIEATQRFCEDHPFINKDKIGCFSASYGGFMTQLLLSKTDIYATGISHAGISSHTSYWGEGYWGYSYSETSMANSYPWTRKDLYVDRSPLYFADRIHTPLLFLHGSADTNVPIGESIQMFTALKLLGQETAFVVVDGENHGIKDYAKRRQWLRTIFAWFSKYLQDDDTWWNELYPEKNL